MVLLYVFEFHLPLSFPPQEGFPHLDKVNPLPCSSAGPVRPPDGDVRTARRRAGGHAGGEHLRGDGGHTRRGAVWLQDVHALHPRTQRGVS